MMNTMEIAMIAAAQMYCLIFEDITGPGAHNTRIPGAQTSAGKRKRETFDLPHYNPGVTSDGKSGDPHARRESGARMQVSEPLVLFAGDDEIHGWTLNISRGGLRAIVDQPLIAGDRYEVVVGEKGHPRAGRVVWVKPDKGG